MKNSDKRMRFISNYISAYEENIELNNKAGLFDAAKLFELFAIEVGGLYFGQKLLNLNIGKHNYPAVDLISSDKSFFVQVSSKYDIPSKIKSTLEKIRDSKNEDIKKIRSIKFFVLNNDSISKVQNFEGKMRIGNIDFNKERDLITTRTIIDRASTDLEFQCKLYEILLNEERSIKDNIFKFNEAIENSKVSLANIESRINGEYEINRQNLVDKINYDNYKNISIQGLPGSGKSVLCKKLVENKSNVLFARAERFLEEKDINGIWGFNIRETLERIQEKEIIFFIDSLEAIADNKAKLELLSILYDCTKDYPQIKIITSCRTSDKTAFIKLESNYQVHSYEIIDLSAEEIKNIAVKYPIIHKMMSIEAYREFLKLPFYINIIVSEIRDISSVKDENQFRDYIWENVICKRGQTYKETIKAIVLDRAKSLSVGVNPDEYNETIVSALVSDGILIKNSNSIRMKYDIFEDICFEHVFDIEFDKCRGDYNIFFNTIKEFGACVYRRYQIWIENKLFAKSNREKFLCKLNFSGSTPLEWQKQTRIALVKSRHSKEFFNDYGYKIIENGSLIDFIKYTNLYAFEIDSRSLSRYVIQLNPSGVGRECLIHLIAQNKWYENNELAKGFIIKLCNDYTNCKNIEKQSAEECLEIMRWMIHSYLFKPSDHYNCNEDEIVKKLLASVYRIANYANKFIEKFWEVMQKWYQSTDNEKISLSKDIIEDALKYEHYNLARYLPNQICKLAEFFWTYTPKLDNEFIYSAMQDDVYSHLTYLYGLGINAKNYEHSDTRADVLHKTFFFWLFRTNFWIGLDWTISFLNRAIESFKTKQESLPYYTIYFNETKTTKSYLGYDRLWLSTAQEYCVPMIISDLLYCLKSEVREIFKNFSNNKPTLQKFAELLKEHIFSKSNNIALLTVISEIGMEFGEVLPGYALDVTSNIDLVLHDLTRKAICMENPQKKELEKQILLSVGLPFNLNKKYHNYLGQGDLIEYFLAMYINGDEKIVKSCSNIVDYLYSIIPNDKEHAKQYLQIQKMDLKNAKIMTYDNGIVQIQPKVSGEAKAFNEKKIESDLDNDIKNRISELAKNIKEKKISAKNITDSIIILSHKIEKSSMSFLYENHLVMLIAYSFTLKDLAEKDRRDLCQIWINGIYKIMHMGGFNFDHNATPILFEQINYSNDIETKNNIKQLILDCISYNEQNGIIMTIAQMAHDFIYNNQHLEIVLFNTIAKLAEDKMKHEKYNSKYIKKSKTIGNKSKRFVPNRQPYLKGIDFYLEQKGKELYKSNKLQIIRDYLYDEKEADFSDFDMQNYDISLMSYALNCRKSIFESNISTIVKKFMVEMINMFYDTEHSYTRHNFFNTFQEQEIQSLLQRDFLAGQEKTENVLNIMFNDVKLSKYNRHVLGFYQEVFSKLFWHYFDAHSNPSIRRKCEKIIYSLESKVCNISDESIKKELYKSLIFSLPKYAGTVDTDKYQSGYTYQDKQFLNEIFSKYGGYHLDELLATIYKLNLNKLLPDIIISLNDALKTYVERCEKLKQMVDIKYDWILLLVITKIFLDYNKDVKGDVDLTASFESILQILRDLGYAEAAVIFDEFKIH